MCTAVLCALCPPCSRDSRPRLRAKACLFALLCVAIIYHAIYNLLVSAGGTPQLIAYFVPLPTALRGHLQKYFRSWAVWTSLPQICETLNKTTGLTVAVTDRDSGWLRRGSARRDLIGKRISTELEQIMEDRAIYRVQGSERSVYVDRHDRCCAAIAAPIISEGDALGLVLFVENEGENHVGETEYKLAQTIASFLGRHMES